MGYCRFLPLLLLLVLPQTVFAGPRLNPRGLEFAFGEVIQGKKVEHTFTFENTGDSDLVIERVRSSCGCTAALLSAERISPGETGEVKAAFDSSRFRGDVTKTITIYTNDPQRQMVTFRLKGVVRPEILIQPERIDLGTLSSGEGGTSRVTLTNQGENEISFPSILVTATGLEAELSDQVLSPGESAKLRLHARASSSGRISGYVILRTAGGTLPEVRIPVRGVISGG